MMKFRFVLDLGDGTSEFVTGFGTLDTAVDHARRVWKDLRASAIRSILDSGRFEVRHHETNALVWDYISDAEDQTFTLDEFTLCRVIPIWSTLSPRDHAIEVIHLDGELGACYQYLIPQDHKDLYYRVQALKLRDWDQVATWTDVDGKVIDAHNGHARLTTEAIENRVGVTE